jgi:hypothetical protein
MISRSFKQKLSKAHKSEVDLSIKKAYSEKCLYILKFKNQILSEHPNIEQAMDTLKKAPIGSVIIRASDGAICAKRIGIDY